MIFFKLRRFDMKYLIITLLLLPTYSFTQEDSIEPPKVCQIYSLKLNYRKIDFQKTLREKSCKKGDVLWITAQTPDNSTFVASRTCVLKTIVVNGHTVICEYSGRVREYIE